MVYVKVMSNVGVMSVVFIHVLCWFVSTSPTWCKVPTYRTIMDPGSRCLKLQITGETS